MQGDDAENSRIARFATDRATTDPAGAGGWADIRQHSAFHRDTLADRIHPAK